MKKLLVLLITFPFLLSINCFGQSVTTTVLTNVHCYGQSNGAVMANPTGGVPPYTYQWLPGSQTNQIANALAAGTYTVHLHDNLGHTATASATVTQPTGLTLSVSAKQSAVCGGQSDSLFASAGGGTVPYQYAWTAPLDDISPDTGTHVNSYPYGVAYMVTAVNDLNGCTATGAVSVTVHTPPMVSVTGPLSPVIAGHSDTLIALAAGATSYLWSNGNTHSSIIVSPAVSTTYSVKAINTYGCYDTARYTVDTNSVGNGSSSGNAIRIVPSTSVITSSYSTLDSVVWFSFIAADSNTQIIAYSNWLGLPTPHVHRLTLYNNSMQTIVDEPMPDIIGASQIRIDISHLNIGSTYYVRAARCPAHANMAGCNPSTHGVCNSTQRWDFQMCFRTVPVFVPDDSGAEAPSTSQLYYECRGQKQDLNGIPRFDIKAYTNFASPGIFASDSAISFVYDRGDSIDDTIQRVDMVLAGTSVQPSHPVFKMEEDSAAGYLNYFLGFVPNGVPKIEGYSRLVYKSVYPNVDMQVYSNNIGTKLYFVCNPPGGGSSAGNPADIELQFKGANSINVTGGGGLQIITELDTLNFAPGFAYTDSAGIVKAKSWQAYFVTVNSNTVRFNTGSYNTNEPLVIQVDRGHIPQPLGTGNIRWCTYVGSSKAGQFDYEEFNDVCVYNTYVYAAGDCQDGYFPVTAGVVDGTYLGGPSKFDAVIVKAFADFGFPNNMVWATFYGGTGDDVAYGVGTDGYEVYVTGYTGSTDFPIATPPNAYGQPFNNGSGSGTDAFVVALNSTGTQKDWATYFGGSQSEVGYHLAVDMAADDGDENYLYVVGGQGTYYYTSTIPTYTLAGAYNETTGLAWIAKFDITSGVTFGKRLWATDIGSNGGNAASDNLFGCCIDGYHNLWVTGHVSQGGFDIVNDANGGNSTYAGQFDGIVAKIDGGTNNIDFSTYYGGDGDDVCKAITTDGSNVYITGWTTSPSITTSIPLKNPVHGYYQGTNGAGTGGQNAFIARFGNDGTLGWSSYFGGNATISGNGIAYEFACDDVYVTGTVDGGLPIPASNPPGTYTVTSLPAGVSNDGFVASFNDPYCAYLWGTYFGATNALSSTVSNAISCDATPYEDVVIAGSSSGTNIPVYNAFQSVNYGGRDAYICDFNPSVICTVSGIDNTNTPEDSISVYPNPTSSNIIVQMDLLQKENMEFIVYDLMGEAVIENTISAEKGTLNQEIDLSSLPNGIYLLKVNEGDIYYTKKIIKQE